MPLMSVTTRSRKQKTNKDIYMTWITQSFALSDIRECFIHKQQNTHLSQAHMGHYQGRPHSDGRPLPNKCKRIETCNVLPQAIMDLN